MKHSLEKYRKDFPPLHRYRKGKPPVYLDNACTTLVPLQVIDAMSRYYTNSPACAGRRSHHWFAEEVTRLVEGNSGAVEGTRHKIARFINAESEWEIIYTLNTTYAINMVALGFNFKQGDVVLLSGREHNSNLLPWLRLQKMGLIKVVHTPADFNDSFNIETYESVFKNNRVRLVSMAYTSNVTGATIPAKEIIAIAHRYGARVLLDGAQALPHRPVDVQDLDVDFLAFSMHKMCGPRGVGILYGKSELIAQNPKDWGKGGDCVEPVIMGGGTVSNTTYDSYSLLEAPERFEAGIQNYSGLIGSGAAIDYMTKIGMKNIAAHEEILNGYMTDKLLRRYGGLDWFKIIGPEEASLRGGILTFMVKMPNAMGIAKELNAKNNIMIRDGVFCVHSYFNGQLGADWAHPKSHHDHKMIYRASLYFYNTLNDCDVFLDTLDDILRERSYI